MKFTTQDEFSNFTYQDVHIADIQITSGFFCMHLDNVTILPENSCNRDIRKMRANNLILRITEGQVRRLVREGFRTYNADGVLMGQTPDEELSPEAYAQAAEAFVDGMMYSAERTQTEDGYQYTFVIDASDERTYAMTVCGSGDTQEWDRFLNPE